MKEIDRMLYKALDPLSIASELNLIACKHRCSGNQVERGAFGMVKVYSPMARPTISHLAGGLK